MVIYLWSNHQRKLGSNTSEVRTNRILSLEMMKGGARLTLDLEGWCAIETWPWRVVRDWERVVRDWHLTLKGGVKGGVRLRLDLEGWCAIETWSWRVVCDWDLTLKGGARLRVDLEGWCETSHDLDEGSLQIGLRLDLEGCCAIETWSWRVVCDWDLTLKGGARLRVDLEGWCETSHDLDEGCLQIGLRLDLEGWCAIETWPWRVVRDWELTLKGGVRLHMTLMKGRCRSDWDLTLKGAARLRLDLEGWCAIETWPWRVVRDWELTLKGGVRLHMTLMKGACRSDWDLTLKGGVRLRLDLDEGWLQIALEWLQTLCFSV